MNESMDEVYQQLQQFSQALQQFHEQMERSMHDLNERFDRIEPLWQDQARRDHDAGWGEALVIIKIFLVMTGHTFIAFFAEKIIQLAQYLFGGD